MKYLLTALLFVLPTGVIFRFEVTKDAFIYPLDAIVLLIFVFYLLALFRKKINPLKVPFAKEIYAFAFFGLFCLLTNSINYSWEELLVSSLYWARYFIYMHLFFVFFLLSNSFKNRFRYFLCFSGFVVVLLGFVQYALYPSLRNLFYLGWDEHLYRIFSTFLDPNFAGAFITLVFITSIYLVLKSKNKISLSILAFLSFVAILLTYSRSSYIMFFFSTLVFLLLLKKKKIFFLGLIILVIGLFLIPKNLGLEAGNLFRTASVTARADAYNYALKIIMEKPIFGVGFNAYRYNQDSRVNSAFRDNAGAGVANSYLFVAVTTGVIGLIIYLWFWIRLVKFAYKNKKEERALMLGVIGGLGSHALFENTLFYIFIVTYALLLLGSFVDKKTIFHT